MAYEKVKGFRTSDGRFFEDEEKAKATEEEIEERRILKKRIEILRKHCPKANPNAINQFAMNLDPILASLEQEGVN